MKRRCVVRPFVIGVIVATCVARGARAQQTASPAECKRPPARPIKAGETIVVKDPARFPCRVAFTATNVALRVDTAHKVPNILGGVFRSSDGRFVTSTGQGSFTVWSRDGATPRPVGKLGRGEGEFAPGLMTALFDRGGRLYVRDNNARWSIFSPTLEFVRTVSSLGMGSDARRSAFLDSGTFLTASQSSQRPGTYFQVYDFARTETRAQPPRGRGAATTVTGPVLVRAFGAVQPGESVLSPVARERFISYSRGDRFWASPPAAAGHGYEFELWNTSGTLLRTIRRQVPWFPRGADLPPPPAPRGKPSPKPPTQLVTFHEDGTGLIYVGIMVPNNKWGAIPANAPRAEQERRLDEMADMYIEVIDGDAGTVLASSGPVPRSRALADFALGLFPGTRIGYRPAPGSSLVPGMQIVEYRLIAQ